MSGQAAGSAGWNKVYTDPTVCHSICKLEGGGKEKINTHLPHLSPLQKVLRGTRGLQSLIYMALYCLPGF